MHVSEGQREYLGIEPPSPHLVRTSPRGCLIEAVGNGIQIVPEEARVDVQGHRRGRVTQHPLDRLDVRPGLDREARGRVPQVVRGHVRYADLRGRRYEHSTAEVVVAASESPGAVGIDAARLSRHIERAEFAVRLSVPGVHDDDPERILAFGVQVDARPVRARRRDDDSTRGLSAEQVAGYLAKYVTKSAGNDQTQTHDRHHRRLMRTARTLARRAAHSGDPDSPYRLLGKRASPSARRAA